MSRAFIRLAQAEDLLNSRYEDKPFALHFTQSARNNKQWGSTDRRELRNLCYAYFRLGIWADKFETKQQALAFSVFLYLPSYANWVESFKEQGLLPSTIQLEKPFENRFEQVKSFLQTEAGPFPCGAFISNKLEEKQLNQSLAEPAKLWFRVKADRKADFIEVLKSNKIDFITEGNNALGLPLGTDLDALLKNQRSSFGEIQDIASQQVIANLKWNNQRVWDCCAASGGKSIQIMQEHKPSQLLCSDVRQGILENLKRRFQEAKITLPKTHILDLSKESFSGSSEIFDMILCDAPCSGSGVFRRNPEAMLHFNAEKLRHYQELQMRIVKNASLSLKKGGKLIYSTCSVYEIENEGQRPAIESMGLTWVEDQYFNYQNQGGDILYRAVFVK